MISAEQWQADRQVVVSLEIGVKVHTFPAAILYDVPGGIGWLEPAYLSPEASSGSGPAHVVRCELSDGPDGSLYFSGPEFSGWIEPAEDGSKPAAFVLRAWKAAGTTLEEQREAFRPQLLELAAG